MPLLELEELELDELELEDLPLLELDELELLELDDAVGLVPLQPLIARVKTALKTQLTNNVRIKGCL